MSLRKKEIKMKTERELLDNFKKYHNANYHDGDNTFDSRTYRMTEAEGFESAFVQDCFEHYEAAWEEQQDKLDQILSILDKLQYSSGERIYKEVEEFLK